LQHDYDGEWAPLLTAVTRRRFRSRAVLAFARVVARLLDAFETAGIERSYKELSDREIRAFIKAGVTRECILLRRETEPERAHSAPTPVFETTWRRDAIYDRPGNLPSWMDETDIDVLG
jgi:hypothetical protein